MNREVSEKLLDQLSAFLDDELAEGECDLLVRRLTRESDLQTTAARYLLIGDVVRRPDQPVLSTRFQRRISESLQESVQEVGDPPSGVVWWRPVAGAAVAATVALVAIVSLRGQIPESETPLVTQSEAVPTESTALPEDYVVPRNPSQLPIVTPARLTSYAVLHSQYSTVLPQQGLQSAVVGQDEELPEDQEPAE